MLMPETIAHATRMNREILASMRNPLKKDRELICVRREDGIFMVYQHSNEYGAIDHQQTAHRELDAYNIYVRRILEIMEQMK